MTSGLLRSFAASTTFIRPALRRVSSESPLSLRVDETASRLAAHPGDARLTNAGLLLFGILFIELTRTGTHEWTHYVHGFSEGLWGQLMLYLGGVALVESSPVNRWTLPLILFIAFAARFVAVFQPPFLSTDIYRYVWDGKVANAGINPFRYIPADPHLAFLRDSRIYPFINRREYAHTIYPPVAQFIFMAAAKIHASVTCMKLIMVGFEAGTCAVLVSCLKRLDQRPERVLLYAWQPVCVWEIGSSGHIDAAAVFFLALGLFLALRDKPLAGVAALVGAVLVKLYPVALLPAFARRRVLGPVLVFAGVCIAAYLPYLSVGRGIFGFLSGYAQEEGISSGARYFPVAFLDRTLHISIAPSVYLGTCALLLGGLAFWAFRRGASPSNVISGSLVLATAFTLCFSPHYPWYFLWLLPFLTLWPWRPAMYMVLAVTYMLATHLGAPGVPIYQMNLRLYGGFFAFLLFDLAQRRWQRHREMRLL